MFYGYCLTPHGTWTPKVKLDLADDCYGYCNLQHNLFSEIMITDEDDYCVMHVKDHILYVPYPDGTFHRFNLDTMEVMAEIPISEI